MTDFGSDKQRFFDNMIETMFEADGVGLAAPQVGVSERIIVVSPVCRRGNERVMVNPVIKEGSGSEIGQEGCLSFPDLYTDVLRMKRIHVQFQDRTGARQEMEIKDFLARVVQHEMDHLEGILMIDRVDFGKRQELLAKYQRLGPV